MPIAVRVRSIASVDVAHRRSGGTPTPRDRVLGLRFGLEAADLVTSGTWGQMAALHGDEVVSVPLTEATAELKLVPDSWYEVAKTFFG